MGGDGPTWAVAMQVTTAETTASLSVLGAQTPMSAPTGGPFPGPDMGQFASYLGISLALILMVAAGGFVVHRMVRGGWRLRAAQRSLRVVDLLPLAGKNQLAVVQVYDRTLVLGIGDGGVRLVTEWDADGPLPSGPAPREPEPGATRSTRAQALLAMLGAKTPTQIAPTAPAKPNFEDDLEAVLERVLPRAVQRVSNEPAALPVRKFARPQGEAKPRVAAAKAVAKGPRPAAASRAAAAPEVELRNDVHIPRNRQRPTIDDLLRAEGVLG